MALMQTNKGDVFWQPNDLWKPDDHIEFAGDFSSFTYEQSTDLIDTISNQYYPEVMPLAVYSTIELAIANPPRRVKEVQAGDKGILVAEVDGRAYHAEAVVTSVNTQSWLSDHSYDDTFIVNYYFNVTKIQIGNITYYVLRCDMGDGTYAELLMTEEEKQHFDQKKYMERRLREDAR